MLTVDLQAALLQSIPPSLRLSFSPLFFRSSSSKSSLGYLYTRLSWTYSTFTLSFTHSLFKTYQTRLKSPWHPRTLLSLADLLSRQTNQTVSTSHLLDLNAESGCKPLQIQTAEPLRMMCTLFCYRKASINGSETISASLAGSLIFFQALKVGS